MRTSIERLADIAPTYLDAPVPHAGSWPTRRPPSFAKPINCQREAVALALEAQARRTAHETIKARALAYLLEPSQLNTIRRGFVASLMTPDQLIGFGKAALQSLPSSRLSLVPVEAINCKAAIVAGRYARAKANQSAERSA